VEHVVIFRVRLFIAKEVSALTPQAVHFYYVQAVSDVLRGNYPTTDEESIQLASIMIEMEYEDRPFEDKIIHEHGRRYLSKTALQKFGTQVQKFKQAVEGERAKIRGGTKEEHKRRYLEVTRQNKNYGFTFYPSAEIQARAKEDMLIGVGENGLAFCHTVTKLPVKKTLKLKEVDNFAIENGQISFTIGPQLNQKKFQFECALAKHVGELFKTYLETAE